MATPKKKLVTLTLQLDTRRSSTASYEKTEGKKTGLSISRFLEALFEANELARTKLNNDELKMMILQEFPQGNIKKSLNSNRTSINLWRKRYNQGILYVQQKKPARISLRYNSHNEPVDLRKGDTLLSKAEIIEACKKYGINDKRYIDRAE